MKRINIYIKDHQYDALQNLSDKTEEKMSELIRRAIDNLLHNIKESKS